MVIELAMARIPLAGLPSLAGQPYPQPHRESRNVVLTLPKGTASKESKVGSSGHTACWEQWAGVTLYLGKYGNINQHLLRTDWWSALEYPMCQLPYGEERECLRDLLKIFSNF